jgi:hypothetical protein
VVIEATIPEAQLLFKWRMPFYYLDGKQGFCYLNKTKNYVDLGFWHGAHLTLHTDRLISENRKHMRSLRYFKPDDVNEEVLIEVLQEAYSCKDKKYYK